MSIVTKTGDLGTTGLMYGRRVPKNHPRVEAYGAIDELNAALGLARASAQDSLVRDTLLAVQKDMVVLMGELATAVEDLQRYVKDGFSLVTAEMTVKLDTAAKEMEAQNLKFTHWATPGKNIPSATLDVARTVCRRGERRVCTLQESGQLNNAEIIVYLNRLSDVLWLLARWTEEKSPNTSKI
jgi:cob(I)alamin adenosyltransferase